MVRTMTFTSTVHSASGPVNTLYINMMINTVCTLTLDRWAVTCATVGKDVGEYRVARPVPSRSTYRNPSTARFTNVGALLDTNVELGLGPLLHFFVHFPFLIIFIHRTTVKKKKNNLTKPQLNIGASIPYSNIGAIPPTTGSFKGGPGCRLPSLHHTVPKRNFCRV